MEEYCIVLTTAGTEEEARQLAGGLVAGRLAACVQVMPVTSTYIWQGELHRDPEWLLLVKTTTARYGDVEAFIQEHHSYQVPEIVQVPIRQGLEAYLAWVGESTGISSPDSGCGGGQRGP
ncbi:MAG: divalent-cation tolerance protein CutA [Thermoflexales bacterium]|nr:divalent-cation tolerance protein CutA [Thermoflexales bacterium]